MKNISLSLSLLVLGILACQRDPEPFPSELQNHISPIVTLNVDNIKVTKALVSAKIAPKGNVNIYRQGIVWDTVPNPTAVANNKEWVDPVSDTFSYTLPNLKPTTTYYVRAYAIDKYGVLVWSEQRSFQTKAYWTQMKPYPGNSNSPGCFYLNGLAYFGGGHASNCDFWAFNPDNNTWDPKASYPTQGARAGITGFVLNGVGYFGTGVNGSLQKLFFSYDPNANLWQPIQDFGGPARNEAVSFAIGNTGYLGFGDGASGAFKDLWSFDPNTGNWTEITPPFPGADRTFALSFVIDDKAYIGFGNGAGWAERFDFYQYDPTAPNPWKEMNSINIPRIGGYSFSVNKKGYIGGGLNKLDFWEFDPYGSPDGKGLWTLLEPPTNGERNYATGLSMGDRGMVLGGTGPGISYKDCWIFSPE